MPHTVCIALDYLETTGNQESGIKSRIIAGIVNYLSSEAYLLEDGWVGMQGIPSNNDFAHMPWFHYNPEKGNPHPDGKRWCVAEQTIGNYYWNSHFIIRDLDILRKFGRLNFELPVLIV